MVEISSHGKAPRQLQSRLVPLDDIEITPRSKGGDGRTVTAYAAVFNRPAEIRDQDGHYSEQIAPTAFNRSIASRSRPVGVFYNHAKTLHGTPSDAGSVPIGSPLEVRPDSRGLLTVTRYNSTPLADAVLEAIKNGDITGQSFTGRFLASSPPVPPGGYMPDRAGMLPLVTRNEIDLVEYGPTPMPAYTDAEIVGVRNGGTLTRPGSAERRWTAEERLAWMLENGITESPAAARVMRAREFWGYDPDEPTELDKLTAGWDRDRCEWCGVGRPFIQAPGRSYYICAPCWKVDQAERRDAEVEEAFALRAALAEFAEIDSLYR